MVGPTNLKPRAESSFEIATDSGVDAGTLADDLGDLCLLLRGTPDSTAIASMRGAIRKIRLAIEAA